MQRLVDTIRATGATNVIALGGVAYSNAIGQWLAYRPADPLNSLMAAWHVYSFNACSSVDCYESTASPLKREVPVLATEIGAGNCDSAFLETLMSWLDAHQIGFLGFSWNAWSTSCSGWSLILNYAGDPTVKGRVIRSHLVAP
jgi:hypothetical protein